MNFKKIATVVSLAAASLFSGGASADPTITNTDGTKSPFGGFDWDSASAAWTTGYTGAVGSSFNLTFAGFAGSVKKTNGLSFSGLKLDFTADGLSEGAGFYEYTVLATFTEKIVACAPDASSCTFNITGGSFSIYYDTTPDAKADSAAWSGFEDGALIVQGTFGSSSQLFSNTNGGQADLFGVVTYTNNAYINPDLVTTNVSSTLQLANKTNITAPTSYTNAGGTTAVTGIVFQADANQTFSTTRVPEPASLALVGLALGAVGFVARRRK